MEKKHPYEVGGLYFIRTGTMALTGRLVAVHKYELVLENAAWIADTGRFSGAVHTGVFSEVEPFPGDGHQVIVGRGMVVDATVIPVLPRQQK